MTPSATLPTETGLPTLSPVVSFGPDAEQNPNASRCTDEQQTSVLHIINGEFFSGAERVQQLLGKRLGMQGFDASFACVKPGKFPEQCQLRSHQVHEFPMRGRFDLSIVKQLADFARDGDFKLLHAHTPRTALITSGVARRTGLPWVYHVHSPTARDSTRGFVNRVNDLVERFSLRDCSRLITVSRSLRREMLRLGVPHTKLSVAPNGVPSFEPIDASARLNQQSWTLGILALMRPRKGIEIAIDAMAQLLDRGVDVTLDLIGSFETPEYESAIRAQIARVGVGEKVRLLGFRSDVGSEIRRLDALLLPSLFGEGMPMVVLEALSAAVPVVATRVEGTPEVIRHGTEGYLATPGDSTDLADQIMRLTAERLNWQELSAAAMARHRSAYTDDHMATAVARAYRKALSK